MGDSITQGWVEQRPGFFLPGRVGRGISGQTPPQMLLRFRQDVIDLHPAVVLILAGTNDIAGNTGPATNRMIEDNFRSMTQLARANGIKVILASILPAAASFGCSGASSASICSSTRRSGRKAFTMSRESTWP